MDDMLEKVSAAHLPALVAALFHMTNDTRWLSDRYRASYPMAATIEQSFSGGYAADVQAEIRTAAAEAIARYLESPQPLLEPDADSVGRMMNIVAGTDVPSTYGAFLREELQLGSADAKRPNWTLSADEAAESRISVAIVGAGMSGLLAAYRLKQAGVPFVVIEKNADLGGTWYENTYPGCRVDNSNHMYSYSFEPNHDFPQYFSSQPVLLDYFRRFADRHRLRESIRFRTTVKRAVFDETRNRWILDIETSTGENERIEAAILVSAVGQLNAPLIPDVPGLADFTGPAFHSAQWDHSVELPGKRIGVIGTGASAYQFVPEIAPAAARLSVFQRTPPWAIPRAHYHADVPNDKKWLLEHVPFYGRWYRFFLFWTSTDGIYATVKSDPAWRGDSDAVSALNADLRTILASRMRAQVEDRPDLRDKIVPSYPFGGKRPLLDNGVWVTALMRDNVELVTSPIVRVVPDGVVTADDRHHHCDVLLYGTGFQASRFLSSLQVIGRGDQTLDDFWRGDARAYLGLTVPGFPNFFMLYGPNTNVVVNGSIIFFSECGVRYILESIRMLLDRGMAAMAVREDVHEAYNNRVDAANAQMAWGSPNVSNWYKNSTGRVSQNWPFPTVDYWQATRSPDPDDFIFSTHDVGSHASRSGDLAGSMPVSATSGGELL